MKTIQVKRNRSNSSLGRGVRNNPRKSGTIEKRRQSGDRAKSQQRKLNRTAHIIKESIEIEKEEIAIARRDRKEEKIIIDSHFLDANYEKKEEHIKQETVSAKI